MSSASALPKTAYAYGLSVLRPSFEAFRGLEARVLAGDDPEAVHDMRVETRRLRAAMSTFQPVLPEAFQGLRSELKWIGAELGAVRDLDVEIESVRAARQGKAGERLDALEALIERLAQAREEARRALTASQDSERYRHLIQAMTDALQAGAAGDDSEAARDYAPDVIRCRYRKLKKAASDLTPDSAPPEFHEVRIRAKRLRYTLEAFAPLYGKRAEELIEEVTNVQDTLGEHQDLIVLNQRLEGLVCEGAPLPSWALVVTGELIERNRARARSIREEWQGLAAIERKWRRLKRELG